MSLYCIITFFIQSTFRLLTAREGDQSDQKARDNDVYVRVHLGEVWPRREIKLI